MALWQPAVQMRRAVWRWTALALIFAATSAVGAPAEIENCMRQAAALHHIDLNLLRAVAKVESDFNPTARNTNTNGTGDTGLMQINDWWLPTLAKFGIKRSDLYDPCTSAYVGAWILAHSIQQHGLTWRAVGAYNSPNERSQKIYAEKVNKALAALQ